MHNGLPVRERDGFDLVCATITALGGSATITDIACAIAGNPSAVRDARGPTTFYGRVRFLVLKAADEGRVEREGRRWLVAEKRRKAS